ncbi:SAM-dependent methyltransferase [Amycolatopsis orientalis]|uniref:SAM-dependent methyltransferase n=1 Tax=Amycolatopsis orientalis TaxID=31958 RepID=UPI0005690C43|nr:SAM-dependent methyltransferase [Amycolatopsis orientalis]
MRKTSIYLLGSGIKGALHFTVETVQALRACRRVFVLHSDQGVIESVREHCAEVEDLAPLYNGQTVRDDVYHEISHRLVESALDSAPVAFLVHGHPLFLVSATEYTLELAEHHDLRVSVLPAVSSFDTLLCDLRIDYGYGVQIFDTTTLLKAGWTPNPQVPLLLFQLASTLNRAVISGDPDQGALRPLIDLLAPLYGADHRVQVVWSSAHILEASSITELPIRELATTDLELWRRPTLYVPAKD